MEPCNSSERDLLYTQDMWENSINVVIILENGHRFKDDPWYGNMLSRMWTGNLTQEGHMKINSRVIGNEDNETEKSKGIEPPKSFEEGCDVCYACPTSKE